MHIHATYGVRQVGFFVRRYVVRQHVEPDRLYGEDTDEGDTGYEEVVEKRVSAEPVYV